MDQQLHPERINDEFFALPELQPAYGAESVGHSEPGLSFLYWDSTGDSGHHNLSTLVNSYEVLAHYSTWDCLAFPFNGINPLLQNNPPLPPVMGLEVPSQQDDSTPLGNQLLSCTNGDTIAIEEAKSGSDGPPDFQASLAAHASHRGQRLTCDHPTCKSSKKTYRGRWELNRHQSSHETAIQRLCPVAGCNRLRRKPFSRIDKLQLHIRGHGESALLRCPVDGCFVQPMALNLLCMHLRVHPWEQTRTIGVGGETSYHNGGMDFWDNLAKGRVCPLSPCYKRLRNTNTLQEHLRTKHDERGRLSQASVVLEVGIEPKSCDFICPLCKQQWADWRPFHTHVRRHLVDVDHALLFVNLIRQTNGESQMAATELEDNLLYWKYTILSKGCVPHELSCPNCSYSVSMNGFVNGSTALWNHHAAMFNDAKILSVRAEILRILPDFNWHPVFDDLRRRDG